MLKNIFLIFCLIICGSMVFAENIPITIIPAVKISTCYDETEVGDKIKFIITKDVYKHGNLYIKKDTPIYGLVDFVSDNGWYYDNAQIDFKEFRTKTVDGKLIIITSPLSINGFDILKYKNKRIAQYIGYCGILFRGKEVEIIPPQDKIEFEIFAED